MSVEKVYSYKEIRATILQVQSNQSTVVISVPILGETMLDTLIVLI